MNLCNMHVSQNTNKLKEYELEASPESTSHTGVLSDSNQASTMLFVVQFILPLEPNTDTTNKIEIRVAFASACL